MQTMYRIKLIVILLLFTFLGCKSTKEIAKTGSETKANSVVKTDSTANQAVQVIENSDKLTETKNTDATATETTEITRTYDGRGAMTSETIKTTIKKNNVANVAKISDKKNTETNTVTGVSETTVTKGSTQTETKTTTENKFDNQRTGTNIKWIVIGLAIIGIVVLIFKFKP